MKKRVVNVPALETGAPYNLCVCYSDLIYVAGLPPFDAEFSKKLREARASGSPPPPFPDLSFQRQAEIVMDNLKTLMEAAGSNMDCLLKVMVWLKDQSQQNEFDRIYRRYFRTTEALPTRTRNQIGRSPMNCDVEVEAVGYIPTD
jgi:2-iminobutanoate/2-iminopropanoate deaminase